MNPFIIGIIIFALFFVFQLLLIIKKEKYLKVDINEKINIKNESKRNIKIFGKILVAIILSSFLSIIGFYISTIIFLGTDLSV